MQENLLACLSQQILVIGRFFGVHERNIPLEKGCLVLVSVSLGKKVTWETVAIYVLMHTVLYGAVVSKL